MNLFSNTKIKLTIVQVLLSMSVDVLYIFHMSSRSGRQTASTSHLKFQNTLICFVGFKHIPCLKIMIMPNCFSILVTLTVLTSSNIV